MSKRSATKKRKKNQSSKPRVYTRAKKDAQSPDGGSSPIALKTEAALDAHLANGKPVVIDFWAPWCGPCKAMTPIFEKVAASYGGRATFLKVNTEEAPALGEVFNIRSIPTLLVMRGDDVVDSAVGVVTEARLSKMVQNALDPRETKTLGQRFRGLFGSKEQASAG